MSDEPQSQIVLYQTEDGDTRIDCRFDEDTLWLTQAQIADLFQTTPQNVTLHLKAIFAEGELAEAATCKEYLQVRQSIRAADSATHRKALQFGRHPRGRIPCPFATRHTIPPIGHRPAPRIPHSRIPHGR